MVIRGLTCDGAISPWVLWCVILLSLLTVGLIMEGTAVGVFCGKFFLLRFRSAAVWLSVVDLLLCGYWRTGSLRSTRRIDTSRSARYIWGFQLLLQLV